MVLNKIMINESSFKTQSVFFGPKTYFELFWTYSRVFEDFS